MSIFSSKKNKSGPKAVAEPQPKKSFFSSRETEDRPPKQETVKESGGSSSSRKSKTRQPKPKPARTSFFSSGDTETQHPQPEKPKRSLLSSRKPEKSEPRHWDEPLKTKKFIFGSRNVAVRPSHRPDPATPESGSIFSRRPSAGNRCESSSASTASWDTNDSFFDEYSDYSREVPKKPAHMNNKEWYWRHTNKAKLKSVVPEPPKAQPAKQKRSFLSFLSPQRKGAGPNHRRQREEEELNKGAKRRTFGERMSLKTSSAALNVLGYGDQAGKKITRGSPEYKQSFASKAFNPMRRLSAKHKKEQEIIRSGRKKLERQKDVQEWMQRVRKDSERDRKEHAEFIRKTRENEAKVKTLKEACRRTREAEEKAKLAKVPSDFSLMKGRKYEESHRQTNGGLKTVVPKHIEKQRFFRYRAPLEPKWGISGPFFGDFVQVQDMEKAHRDWIPFGMNKRRYPPTPPPMNRTEQKKRMMLRLWSSEHSGHSSSSGRSYFTARSQRSRSSTKSMDGRLTEG